MYNNNGDGNDWENFFFALEDAINKIYENTKKNEILLD